MDTTILDHIKNHRSIRKFKPDAVPESLLNEVLNAALRASSSGNMQAYSVIVTTDPEIRAELAAPHFHQSMVQDAPVFLTFCADFHRMRKWLKLREAPENFDNFMSFMIGSIDAILAAQNAALAAEALSLGICFLGTTLASCDEIGRILKCPEHVVPVVGFSLGYPDEQPSSRDRLPIEALVHRERYQAPSTETVERTYEQRETAGWDRYMAIPELRQKVEESGARNLAQIYTKVKYTRESHEAYSRTVQAFLKAQGFTE